MKLKQCVQALAIITLAACSEQPISVEQQFVDDVSSALGGKNAIESVSTVSMQGEGRLLNLGQDLVPESTTMEFEISDYRLAADLANGSSRTELSRTPLFELPAPRLL